MITRPSLPKPDRDPHLKAAALKAGIWAMVAVTQLGLVSALGLVRAAPPTFDVLPPMLVTLVRPDAPPPPPPPVVTPAPVAGGGAPAAPSRVHLPQKTPDRPPEIVAPPVPAPAPTLVIGVAPLATPTPGMGQGGQGQGTGEGTGDGDGPGRGGTPPIILRGATPAEVLSVVPPEARRARVPGRAAVNCVIRLDERLDDCRVVSETPAGYRFGEAGLRAAAFFRYRPPGSAAGRPLEGQRVTINVLFGRQ